MPRAARETTAVDRRARLVRTFRVYDPLAIALLGVMVMTGAWSVTGFKQSLGADYGAFAAHLAWKLALAFLVAPRQGVRTRWWRQRSQAHRVARENTLKAVYHVLESLAFRAEKVALLELAQLRKITLAAAESEARHLAAHDLASVDLVEGSLVLTPAGWQRACEIVRNHRLWELYLTHTAQIAADHVHEDAEKIEHVLGEDVVRELERRLNYATKDPHGKVIPAVPVTLNAPEVVVP